VTPPPSPTGFRSKLGRAAQGTPRLQRAIAEAEEACRAAAGACMGFLQANGARSASDVDVCAHLVMDCSYIAAATGRLLGRFDRHDPEVVMFQLEVCRRAAAACADSCHHRASSSPILEVCSRLSRQCARSCAALLALFRAQPAVLLSEEGDEQSAGAAAPMSEVG
jgi:hypothetical protein